MRLTYVGNFIPEWSTENDVRKAFEHIGWEVIKAQENTVSWQDIRFHALNSDLLLWTSTWDNAQPIRETLETVRLLGLKNIPSAAIHLDVFHNTDRGSRQWWMNPQWSMAYVFTASGDYEKEWKNMGVRHYWLPPAVRHDACHFGKFREEYACDVAFVGSNGQGYHDKAWPYRKELLNQLREMCKRNGWTFKNPGGDAAKIDRGEDMNDFLASAKVTVGDSLCLKKEDSKYWSDRVPEATGRGGFLIMPKIDALDGNGWVIPQYEWGDFEKLETMIKHFMHQDSSREEVKKQNLKSTSSGHTYINRAETILKEVGL